jgi:hypothetical protein
MRCGQGIVDGMFLVRPRNDGVTWALSLAHRGLLSHHLISQSASVVEAFPQTSAADLGR